MSGSKKRDGFLWGWLGCVLWVVEGALLGHTALVAIEVMLAFMYMRGWLNYDTEPGTHGDSG